MIQIFVYKPLHVKIFSPETYTIALASGGAVPPDPLLYMPTTLVHPLPPNPGSAPVDTNTASLVFKYRVITYSPTNSKSAW